MTDLETGVLSRGDLQEWETEHLAFTPNFQASLVFSDSFALLDP